MRVFQVHLSQKHGINIDTLTNNSTPLWMRGSPTQNNDRCGEVTEGIIMMVQIEDANGDAILL
ncbi:11901_t:CDS:2 [Acaulospora morrowiae]|uniref:11901_t:CDS:1 n=1 Tax=Acaulospora morrowiae TaxID=94023 RepID=A0A9N8V690_9GLOM|nr:11901_t:CDS:2 [Acaulospora morrowiae]